MLQFNIDEIEKRTLSGLKDFQRATVERVDYLFRHNQNRVLVADEVGMGKTLIARGAIVKTARLRIEEKDDLFKVIYICSNQNIANQNIRKLDVTGKNAIGSVSDTRLSMQHLKITEQENDPQIKGFIAHIDKLRSYLDAPEEIHLGRKPEDLLETLVNMVLGSPAICIYRSNGRSTARATCL